MKTNIALIGYMGTGKTIVGQLLAQKLEREFLDMDLMIEQKTGKSIPDIFRQDGQIAFRELEMEIAKDVSDKDKAVISCGGGIVLNQVSIDRLRLKGRIIYLTAAPSVILKRVSREVGQRPMLDVDNPVLAIRRMLKQRQPFYDRAADLTINTSRLDTDAVAEQIIDKLKEDEGFSF